MISIFFALAITSHGGDARELGLAGSAIGASGAATECRISALGYDLPSDLRESSGLAQGRSNPDLFWSHNDAGNSPVLYGVSSEGNLGATVRIQGATLKDWEDIEAGRCGGTNCLFVGDIGDNNGNRSTITVYRVEEPVAGAASAAAT